MGVSCHLGFAELAPAERRCYHIMTIFEDVRFYHQILTDRLA